MRGQVIDHDLRLWMYIATRSKGHPASPLLAGQNVVYNIIIVLFHVGFRLPLEAMFTPHSLLIERYEVDNCTLPDGFSISTRCEVRATPPPFTCLQNETRSIIVLFHMGFQLLRETMSIPHVLPAYRTKRGL
jgi:hypothetical protein